MQKDHPLVSIITVNYNQVAVTCEMIDSLTLSQYTNFEVIVVDNASKENPKSIIERKYPFVKVIRSEENLGFSGGNNIGIQAAKGDYFFFINNDTEITPSLIATLLNTFIEIPDLGIVSPLICYHPRPEGLNNDLIQYAGTTKVNTVTARNKTLGEKEEDLGQFKSAKPTAYVHGAAMMIPRKVVEEVGMMPELFFLYYEELDWSEQIRKKGYKIYIDPRAKIYHKESISVGKTSVLKTHYLNRNRVLFVRRNRSFFERIAFYTFLTFFTIPKNVVSFILKKEWAHLGAFRKAIVWHFNNPAFDENQPKLMPQSKLIQSKTNI